MGNERDFKILSKGNDNIFTTSTSSSLSFFTEIKRFFKSFSHEIYTDKLHIRPRDNKSLNFEHSDDLAERFRLRFQIQKDFIISACVKWLICLLVGILMALLSRIIIISSNQLQNVKISIARTTQFYQQDDYQSTPPAEVIYAWFIITLYTLILATISALCIIYKPTAGGSGIPETLAFLNGAQLKGAMTLSSLVMKLASMILAVGSGLVAGTEGPTIHAGASLSVVIVKILCAKSRWFKRAITGVGTFKERFGSRERAEEAIVEREQTISENGEKAKYRIFLDDFNLDSLLRDFAAYGSSAGIAVAVHAPMVSILCLFLSVEFYLK